MNLADLAFLGFPSDFKSFFDFVLFLINGSIDFVFIVWVLNFVFSMLHDLVLSASGVKGGRL